jgi:hypothetical protein
VNPQTKEEKGLTCSGDLPHHPSSQKSSSQCIKEKRGSMKMVVGDDVPLSNIPHLLGKILVGRFNDKYLGERP